MAHDDDDVVPTTMVTTTMLLHHTPLELLLRRKKNVPDSSCGEHGSALTPASVAILYISHSYRHREDGAMKWCYVLI